MERQPTANCCRPGIMSFCGAGPDARKQRTCRFFRRASLSERCMHYCAALEGHCDCAEAQRECRAKP